jgi:hypothetical protein
MPTDSEAQVALAKQEALAAALGEAYADKLDEEMGKLHNQFVAFISASQLPLPQVSLVLMMVMSEVVEQARKRYMGE